MRLTRLTVTDCGERDVPYCLPADSPQNHEPLERDEHSRHVELNVRGAISEPDWTRTSPGRRLNDQRKSARPALVVYDAAMTAKKFEILVLNQISQIGLKRFPAEA
jgi:hypothetical protein